MNKKLIDKVFEAWDSRQILPNMNLWSAECGTVACFAGAALLLSGVAHSEILEMSEDGSVSARAKEALGIETTRVFYPNRWPDEIELDYAYANSVEKAVDAIAEAVFHFTGYKPRRIQKREIHE